MTAGRRRLRVALVNPPDSVNPDDAESHAPPPLGLGYVASYARKCGFAVDLYDLADLAGPRFPENLVASLAGYDVIGFTSYTKTFREVLRLAKRIRRLHDGVVIVVGGPHATPCAREIVTEHSEIDFVITHDGEVAFSRLLEQLASPNRVPDVSAVPGLVWRTGRSELSVRQNAPAEPLLDPDSLPFPARDFVVEPNRILQEPRPGAASVRIEFIVGTRGCPKRCTFCSIIVMAPKWRRRSVENIMAEVAELHARQPFGHLVFMDANFFVDVRRAVSFSEALFEFDPSITWEATATADHVVRHPDAIAGVARNCTALEIGIESGSASVLTRFGKRTTVADNLAALRILRRNGIKLDLDFIMFDPWTTLAELNENLEFLRRADLVGYYPADVLYNPLKIYPGTSAHDRALAEFELEAHHLMHLLPPFVEPGTAAVFGHLDRFRREVQEEIDLVLPQLERCVAEAISSGLGDLEKVQRAQLAAVGLRHAGYEYFEATLRAVERGDAPLELPPSVTFLVDEASRLHEQLDAAITNLAAIGGEA